MTVKVQGEKPITISACAECGRRADFVCPMRWCSVLLCKRHEARIDTSLGLAGRYAFEHPHPAAAPRMLA